jgi:hypothetical protein
VTAVAHRQTRIGFVLNGIQVGIVTIRVAIAIIICPITGLFLRGLFKSANANRPGARCSPVTPLTEYTGLYTPLANPLAILGIGMGTTPGRVVSTFLE